MAKKNNDFSAWSRAGAVLCIVCLALVFLGCGATAKQKEIASNHVRMGIAYLGERQDNQALRSFLEAEELDPRNERIHYFKSFVYVNRGMFADAKISLQRAIKLNPRYSQAQTFLGSLYLHDGEHDTAISHFQKALDNPIYDAPAAAIYNLGWAHFYKGDYQKALAVNIRALEIDPDSPLRANVQALLGKIYLTTGNYSASLTHYKEAETLAPDNAETLFGLAQAKLGLGDKAGARQLLKRVIATDKEGKIAAKAKEILKVVR